MLYIKISRADREFTEPTMTATPFLEIANRHFGMLNKYRTSAQFFTFQQTNMDNIEEDRRNKQCKVIN